MLNEPRPHQRDHIRHHSKESRKSINSSSVSGSNFSPHCKMARSSGARPKKAVRKEVKALKARLGTITSDRWQAAQAIFDQICALCDVSGPSGALMVPRSCRHCGYYGHTRQFCPRVTVALDKASGYETPRTEEECPGGPAQWKWICQLRAIDERAAEGHRRGLGQCTQKTIRSAADVDLNCQCVGCVEWSEWMADV